jgi:hypothetical protein
VAGRLRAPQRGAGQGWSSLSWWLHARAAAGGRLQAGSPGVQSDRRCAASRIDLPAAVYELTGEGLDGQEKLFQKPWAMTTVMFIGGRLAGCSGWLLRGLQRWSRAAIRG